MLAWIFGEEKLNVVNYYSDTRAAGYMELERARVKWFLSLEYEDVPDEIKAKGQRTFRAISVDGEEVEFSGGFTDLHTVSYQKILEGKGFGIEDARKAIELTFQIRNTKPIGKRGEYHPFLNKVAI
jgi:UDP-N-acetyl-2-amino-2-deoxyglucuronate dehydrogenase